MEVIMIPLGFVKFVLLNEELHLYKSDDADLHELFSVLKFEREGDPALRDEDDVAPETQKDLRDLLKYAKGKYTSLTFPYKK